MTNQNDYQRGYDDGYQAGRRSDAYRWYSEQKAKDYLDRERECMELRAQMEKIGAALFEYLSGLEKGYSKRLTKLVDVITKAREL